MTMRAASAQRSAVRRVLRALLGAVLLVGAGGMATDASAQSAPAPAKVVVIVGPVGGLTDYYRSVAAAAAAEARRWTGDVTTIASPNATWSAVKRALQGASIVVYLGHGNGFPSPYGHTLVPATQNGLGLNPVAGVDDVVHQYFGETYLARDVRLAPGAAIVLGHLCYASGNSEPGLVEGSLDVARQRVDNYAAGWIRAGAGLVLADTFGDPAWYIRDLFAQRRTVDATWRSAPSFHDHVLEFASERSSGYQVALDPDKVGGGYHRSLVRSLAVGAHVWSAVPGANGGPTGGGPVPPPPWLPTSGVAFGAPALTGNLTTGGTAALALKVTLPPDVRLRPGTMLGVRWIPIDLIQVPDVPSPASTAAPGAPPPLPEPPTIELSGPQEPASVLTTARARAVKGSLITTVNLPAKPGLYRLEVTIHDSDGAALAESTQALIPALLVRVAAPLSARYALPPLGDMTTGQPLSLPVRVANDGRVVWTSTPTEWDDGMGPDHPFVAGPRLAGSWMPLGSAGDGGTWQMGPLANLVPGSQALMTIDLVAPSQPGSYLLVIDIVHTDYGSLASVGVPPAIVRIEVVPPPVVEPHRPSRDPHEAV